MSESERTRSLLADLMSTGMSRAEALSAITALETWTIPIPSRASTTRLLDRLASATNTRAAAPLRRILRPVALAGIAAILLIATVLAASPGLRSAVAGWFGSGTTVHSPLVLGSVDFLNPRLGFVTVGNTRTHRGFLYKTTNGGDSWRVSLHFRTGGDIASLGLLGTSVTFINRNVGLLYTAYGSPTSEKLGDEMAKRSVHIHGVLHRTVDGGATWTRVALPTEPWQAFISLSFISRAEGWVLVSSGTTMSQSSIAEFHTSNSGKSWQLQAFGGYDKNSVLVSNGGLHEGSADETIHFISQRVGWILGNEFASGDTVDSVTTNGGRLWRACRAMPPSFYGIRPIPRCTGPVPPARFYREGRQLGGSGQVFVTQLDAGNLFGSVGLLPVMETIPSSIHGNELASDSGYFMYHLNRSRTSWTKPMRLNLGFKVGSEGQTSALNTAGVRTPAVNIESSRDWFFTNGSTIAYTTDGGRSWTHVPSPLRGRFVPGGIKFFSNGQGFVWGGSINQVGGPYSPRSVLARTLDLGRTWTTLKLPIH
jgi:photosystem II stability/assembly factor-like uncharacterized protein